MAFTLNGFGTRYHGTKWLPDGTFVTTKWFVFLYVPLIPISSVRVLEASAVMGSIPFSSQSLKVQEVPLDTETVRQYYLKSFGGVAVLVAVIAAINWLTSLTN